MALAFSRLYFAYGPNLSSSEMLSRCPTSSFYSIALLRNHRWFVNERGYANVVPSTPSANGLEDVVWGILYTLRPFDEDLLDKHEGLPWAYSKEDMDVEAISIARDGRGTKREIVRALVYIDRERVQESYAWPEFVAKMNKGIKDAVERGVPQVWFDGVVRSYITETGAMNGADQEITDEARSQPQHAGRAAPVTPRDSDRASNTQESVGRAHVTNGGSPKATSNRSRQLYGLENSKYAHASASDDVSPRNAAQGPDRPSINTNTVHSGAQPRGNKLTECWWWKVQGNCRYPDNVCHFAHYATGVLAEAPSKKKKGPAVERNGSVAQSKKGLNQDKGKWSKHSTDHENSEHDKGKWGKHSTDHENSEHDKGKWGKNAADHENNEHADGFAQGFAQEWSEQKENPIRPPDKVEDFDVTTNKQVENLMDSQPDWLASNDRTDVKW